MSKKGTGRIELKIVDATTAQVEALRAAITELVYGAERDYGVEIYGGPGR